MSHSPHLALAESIVAEGFDRHESAVTDLITDARHREINAILLAILADRSAPRVVRERALGRVIVAIARRGRPRGVGHSRLAACAVAGTPDHAIDMLERECA